MKAETVLATMIMAVCGLIFVVMAAGALAPPATQGAPQPARQQAPAQSRQPVVLATREPLQIGSTEAQGDAAARDLKRLNDFQAIAAALQSYKDKKRTYPDTNSRLQSACVYEAIDKLCEIKGDVGVERLRDVRGANTYGYWYISDGSTYTLVASLEAASSLGDPCPQLATTVPHPNLFCLNSHR
jgi:hypothetical protein